MVEGTDPQPARPHLSVPQPPRILERRVLAASLLAVGVAAAAGVAVWTVQSSAPRERPEIATAATSSPAASGTAAAGTGCDVKNLDPDDQERLAVYEAGLAPFFAELRDGGPPPRYITDHPVSPSTASTQAGETFSPELLGCFRAGTRRLPPLQPVNGFSDPRIARTEPASRLVDGRLVAVSAVGGALADSVDLFMSLNGGGGFDYSDRTVRLVRADRGAWTLERVLRRGIA